MIPYLTKTLQVSHHICDRFPCISLDTDLLFQDPNIDEGFIVAEDMDRSLVVKENPFPWQPDLANIPVAVKKNCLLSLPSSIP